MITLYQCDARWIYQGPIELDEFGPIPANVVVEEPPELTPPQVAQWVGGEWVVLDVDPGANPAPAPGVQLDPIDFLRLFTPEETFTILQAAAVDPMVATFKYRLDKAKVILLSDPDIQAGVPLLEAGGLIGVGRAAQILAGEAP